MNYARGLSVTALATGLTFALGFANQALLARMLGEEGRGALAAVATTVLLATLVIGEWVNRGNTFIAGHQPTRASSLLSLTLVWTALLSVVFAIGLWLAGRRREALCMLLCVLGFSYQRSAEGPWYLWAETLQRGSLFALQVGF